MPLTAAHGVAPASRGRYTLCYALACGVCVLGQAFLRWSGAFFFAFYGITILSCAPAHTTTPPHPHRTRLHLPVAWPLL